MQLADNYILMADIIKSSQHDQKQLMSDFEYITQCINQQYRKQILSPLTITLGDEFQSVIINLSSAVKIIISLEEKIIQTQPKFKLRYVLVEGAIDTPINEKIAHGMLGEGLTRARQNLMQAKGDGSRFHFELRNQKKHNALNSSFLVYQSIVDNWNVDKDRELIKEFLKLKDYKKVADNLGKSRSQIWKREKSLKINEYIAIKDIIHYIGK